MFALKFERLEEKDERKDRWGDLQTIPRTGALFIQRDIDDEL